MFYLDSNVFLYALLDQGEKGIHCKKIITKVAKQELVACTSFLTWDEFVHILTKYFPREIVALEGERFLHFPHLNFLIVDSAVLFKAQEFISTYALDPRDAIHAATAFVSGVQHIVSDDLDFDTLKEIKRIPLDKV